jgi:hypothetical protein
VNTLPLSCGVDEEEGEMKGKSHVKFIIKMEYQPLMLREGGMEAGSNSRHVGTNL